VPPPPTDIHPSSLEIDATGASMTEENVAEKLLRLENQVLRLSRGAEERDEKAPSGMEVTATA
jgi:hypothetical protein